MFEQSYLLTECLYWRKHLTLSGVISIWKTWQMVHKSLSNVFINTLGLRDLRLKGLACSYWYVVWWWCKISKVIQKERDSLISAITVTFITMKHYTLLERQIFLPFNLSAWQNPVMASCLPLRNCEHSPNICSCSPHSCPYTLMEVEHVPAL